MSQRSQNRDDPMVRRYEYDDEVVLVADLPVADEDVSVDLFDDVAIVVAERDGRSVEHELELPEGTAKALIRNGVVSIEVSQ